MSSNQETASYQQLNLWSAYTSVTVDIPLVCCSAATLH